MVRLIKVLGILLFMVGCGCSGANNNALTPGVCAEQVYPVLYTTDADADTVDELYIAAYDRGTSAYVRQQIGDDLFIQNQWSAQRNNIVYRPDGTYGVVAVEDMNVGGLGLVLWESADAGTDIVNTWTLTDDDSTYVYEWAESLPFRGNIHIVTEYTDTLEYISYFLCNNGSSTLTLIDYGGGVAGVTAYQVSLAQDSFLNQSCVAGIDEINATNNNLFFYRYSFKGYFSLYAILFGAPPGYTHKDTIKILTDYNNEGWLFFQGNTSDQYLECMVLPEVNSFITTALDFPIIELPVNLSAGDHVVISYDAVCNYMDNTLHMVYIEKDPDTVARRSVYDYYYMRRDCLGWSTPLKLKEITAVTDAHASVYDPKAFINIGVDLSSNIIVYFTWWDKANARTDLYGELLPFDDYSGYATIGNWVETTNIDNSTAMIRCALTLGNQPV